MGVPVEFCAPWVDADRLCCPDVEDSENCAGDPVTPTYLWTDEELIEAATGILFRQTCHLFPGECDLVVRPCSYCACNRQLCGCGRYVFIDLQDRYPIIAVTEVTIDGVVLDPSAYRVDDFHRLVRTDGECWPRCNNFDLPDTEPGTFTVSYTAGRTPPIELQMAAAELACQLKRACGGVDCNLPDNVRSVSRAGVTLDLGALEDAVNGGTSGLAAVDLAVRRYNCARAKGRVWHPSLKKPRGVFPS